MTLAAVYLGEAQTHIAIGKPKNDKLSLTGLHTAQSYLSRLLAGDKRTLSGLFADVLSAAGKDAEIYVVLPATLVKLDCTDSAYCNAGAGSSLMSCAASLLQVEEKDYQISLLEKQRRSGYSLTAAALHQNHMQTLMQAAKMAKADLVYIEPEQIAVLRYLDVSAHVCVVSLCGNDTAITGHHPQKGTFTRVLPGYGYSNILDQAPGAFANTIIRYDILALETFGNSQSEPVYITGERAREVYGHVGQEPEIATRLSYSKPNPNIAAKNISAADMETCIAALGMALQPIYAERGGPRGEHDKSLIDKLFKRKTG